MNPNVCNDSLESQCGFLKNKSCVDVLIPLKTALKLRKEHGPESFVICVDLVKVFDIVNHELIFLVLEKYGYSLRITITISKIYKQFPLCFKEGSGKEMIDYLIVVHQDYILAPLLFVPDFQAAMETLEQVEERTRISLSTY